MEIDEIDGNNGHIFRHKKIDEIQVIVTTEKHKRNLVLSTKYNRGVNIFRVIDTCLGFTAIGLAINGVGLLSTIVATPAVIGKEAVSIDMGLLRVIGNRANKMLSLKMEKHEEIAMLAVLSLNTVSGLISKALSNDSISDEEYSLILLKIEAFARV